MRAHLLEHVDAVDFRQHDVEQNQIINVAERVIHAVLPVVNHIHKILFLFQNGRRRVRKLFFIFHDQNTHKCSSFFFVRIYPHPRTLI